MANTLLDMMGKAGNSYGIKVEDPQWVEVQSSRPEDYNKEIKANIDRESCQIVVVMIFKKEAKAQIKQFLDIGGIPSQFLLSGTIQRAKIGVYSNILKQMNAKTR